MYILFHAVMIGILGTTMYRFVDWFEPIEGSLKF